MLNRCILSLLLIAGLALGAIPAATAAPVGATPTSSFTQFSLGARSAGTVMPNEIERWFVYLRDQRSQSDGSVRRHRASVSSFFAWCVAEHRRADYPVAAARVPTRLEPPAEMRPFSEDKLAEVVDRIGRRSRAR